MPHAINSLMTEHMNDVFSNSTFYNQKQAL